MRSLIERQREFGDALLDPGRPVPEGILGRGRDPSPRRFNVYRNNVVAGLIGAIKDAYPVVAQIVGDEFFSAMASGYVTGHPPANPVMLTYGSGFPEFIEGFSPAAGLPYLPGVARIEWAWIEAYHAAEAAPIDTRLLATQEPSQVRVEFHPSARIVQSDFPVLTIWKMHTPEGIVHPVRLDSGGEDVLIVRPDGRVDVHLLPAGTARLVEALRAGEPLLSAVSEAALAREDFDLAAALTLLLESGAITDIRSNADGRHGLEGAA